MLNLTRYGMRPKPGPSWFLDSRTLDSPLVRNYDAATGRPKNIRESLDKALARGAKARFGTVMRVAKALGVEFTARAVKADSAHHDLRSNPQTAPIP